jgi:hypothetical protein
MLEETTNGTNLSRRAVLLMGEVMHLANRLLPSHTAAIIQVEIPFPSCERPLSITYVVSRPCL